MSLKRLAGALALLLGAIVALSCAALSPYALNAAATSMKVNWRTLADVGQAYGGISALVSAIALAGVVTSIVYQVRAVRQQRHLAFREQQRELLSLLASDPETYALAFSRERAAMDPLELRRDVYAQMWIQFYFYAYESGHYSEEFLRSSDGAESLFDTRRVRLYWGKNRPKWLADTNPKARNFVAIMDDSLRKVLEAGTLPDPEPRRLPESDAVDRKPAAAHLAIGAVALVAAGWLAGRRRR